jgi:hypothetical protein
MLKHGCLLMLLALGAAGCGGEPPQPKAPAPTVFDPLVEKKEAVPAAVQAAEARHQADMRQQVEAAEGGPPAEARR